MSKKCQDLCVFIFVLFFIGGVISILLTFVACMYVYVWMWTYSWCCMLYCCGTAVYCWGHSHMITFCCFHDAGSGRGYLFPQKGSMWHLQSLPSCLMKMHLVYLAVIVRQLGGEGSLLSAWLTQINSSAPAHACQDTGLS